MLEGTVTKRALKLIGYPDGTGLWSPAATPDDGTVSKQVFEQLRTLILAMHEAETSLKTELATLAREVERAQKQADEGQQQWGKLATQAARADEASTKLDTLARQFNGWLAVWKNCGGMSEEPRG